MPKISIIVPVYNAEKYLNECVDSILSQTLTDIEVILVDDGSTDSSPAICDEYAAKDLRVKTIHKTNGRAASARNAGLRIATGEYVAFVDSDDIVLPQMYETMVATDADVCMCDYVRFKGKQEFPFSQQCIRDGYYTKEQIRKEIYPHLVMDGVEYPITISNWVLVIKHTIIKDNNLQYREDIHISEDAPFGSEVLYCAKSFAYLKGRNFYRYRMTEGSASKTYKSWWWDSYLMINEETENFFSKCTDYDFTQQIKANMFYLVRSVVANIMKDNSLSRGEQNIKIKDVLNHPRTVSMMNGYDTSELAISFKINYWGIRLRSVKLNRFVSTCSKITNTFRKRSDFQKNENR